MNGDVAGSTHLRTRTRCRWPRTARTAYRPRRTLRPGSDDGCGCGSEACRRPRDARTSRYGRSSGHQSLPGSNHPGRRDRLRGRRDHPWSRHGARAGRRPTALRRACRSGPWRRSGCPGRGRGARWSSRSPAGSSIRQVERLVDDLPAGDVGPVDERDRDAGGTGAAGAADPVDVGLLVLGAGVVDHVRDADDVDAAGGDVGGDEDLDRAVAEPLERALAGHLRHVAVQRSGREAALDQVLGDPLGLALGAGEDEGQTTVLGLHDPGDDLGLVEVVRLVDELRGRRDHRVSVLDSARMLTGWRMWVRARVTTSPRMVAEKSIVCRSSGVLAISRSTSGRKPRSSISSASSRTSTLTWDRSSAPRAARSSSRPGVPTTTSTPVREQSS